MLRQRGGRVTTARRAIVAALLQSSGHVTADELTATVQAAQPDVHSTTIYRCLGIAANTTALQDPTGRPQHLLDRAEPVREIL